eukprot:gb/GECG01001394.1/.p1 GENE.gb/GECG01001394.1/~~gb/GECG01001394.1/.p1  ORF type:complete len:353 (+),score=65.04 gb/GECG01001394.1/:1-1059(+)
MQNQSIEGLQEKLQEQKQQLSQIENLLQNDPSNQELLNLKQDITRFIDITADLLKSKQTSSDGSGAAASTATSTAYAPSGFSNNQHYYGSGDSTAAYATTGAAGASASAVTEGTPHVGVGETTIGSITTVGYNTSKKIEFSVGMKVEARSKVTQGPQQVFFPGIITSIKDAGPEKGTVAIVRYLGFNTDEELPFTSLRPMQKSQGWLPANEVKPGMKCQAKYPPDGKWYPAKVEQPVTVDSAVLKAASANTNFPGSQNAGDGQVYLFSVNFPTYGNTEVLPLEYIKRAPKKETDDSKYDPENAEEAALKQSMEAREFVIPEHLRVLQTDSEAEKLRKRKKVKALKYKFNKQQ